MKSAYYKWFLESYPSRIVRSSTLCEEAAFDAGWRALLHDIMAAAEEKDSFTSQELNALLRELTVEGHQFVQLHKVLESE